MNELRPEADLHCHILPDWDDGPRNWDETLALARAAFDSGIRQILVTPHVGRKLRGIEEKPSDSIVEAARELEEKLRAEGVEISLVPAAELTMDSEDLAARLKAEPNLTIGGQGYYALIESTFNRWPAYAERFLQDVFFAGITPIIAHPERYAEVQRDPMILRAAFEKGALMQITARSLLGEDDRRVKACALALLKANMVSIIASDAHNARAVFPEAVVETIVKTVGESAARRILIENPRKILAGDPVYNPDIKAARSTGGFLGKLLGR
jgi:protein-tyrosine phosphatase